MKKAIVIGASSGIGKSLATILSENGYALGLAARRFDLLSKLGEELPGETYPKTMDLCQPAEAMEALTNLIREMNGVDLVVISSGVSFHNPDLAWDAENRTVAVNVAGFTAVANTAFNYFSERGNGHLVGISSFRGLRGGWSSPAYNASKAFMSNYLEGLRIKSKRTGKRITVTDIRPGLVAAPMIGKKEGLLVAPVGKAARQIWKAIESKREKAYVTKRYCLIAYLIQKMPFSVYSRL